MDVQTARVQRAIVVGQGAPEREKSCSLLPSCGMCEAVYAHLLEQEPCALDSLAKVVQRLELDDRALEALVLVARRAAVPILADDGRLLADRQGWLRELYEQGVELGVERERRRSALRLALGHAW